MKRLSYFRFVNLLLAVILAGCGGGAGGIVTTEEKAASVTLKLSSEGTEEDDAGDTVTFVATAYRQNGKPRAGASMTMKAIGGDAPLAQTVVTDSMGQAVFTVQRSLLGVPAEGGSISFSAECDNSVSNLVSVAFGLFGNLISITATEDETFEVDAVGMTGLCGVKLKIEYDAAEFSDPQVIRGNRIGNDWMMISNVTVPGTITIAAISPTGTSATGTLATIRFKRTASSAGSPVQMKITEFEAVVETSGEERSLTPAVQDTVQASRLSAPAPG